MPQDSLENWQISWPYLNKLAVVKGRLRWSMTSFGQLRSLNFVVWSCATAAWSPSTPSAPRQRSEDRKVFGSWTCETEGINDPSASLNKSNNIFSINNDELVIRITSWWKNFFWFPIRYLLLTCFLIDLFHFTIFFSFLNL